MTHATRIWSQLQKEVFSDVNNAIKMECLNTLTAVINKISQSEKENFNTVLNNIASTLKGNLLPDSKLFEPSISILLHTALGSQESSVYITKEIIPLLTNTFVISHDPTQKAALLKALVQFAKAYLKYNNEKIYIKNDHFDNVPLLCLKASTEAENNLRLTGFESLADLAEILSLDVRLSLYKHLHCVIITEPELTDVRTSILNCLKNVSILYPNEISEHVLYKSKIADPFVLNLYLNALCVIATLDYFKDIVTDCLMAYCVDDVELATIALKNVKDLLNRECNNADILELFIQRKTINKLVEYALMNIHTNNDRTIKLLQYTSCVLKILIGCQDFDVQKEMISNQINVINSYEHCEELYVLLLDGLLSRVRKGLLFEASMFAFLTKTSLVNNDILIRDVSVQLLANLINKHPDGNYYMFC